MKYVILACLIAFVASAPQKDYRSIQTLRDDRDVRPDGYSFAYETDDGVKRSEEGTPTNTETKALGSTGEVEFVHPDGSVTVLTFVADENGYRPKFTFRPKRK